IPPRDHDRHAHSADDTRAISPIGVGYDGSGVSEDAVDLAIRLAATKNARLEVIGATGLPVWPTIGLPDGPVPAAVLDPREIEDLARESVEGRVADIDDTVRAEAVVLVGDPAESLIDRSAELHLLVLGSRDFGPVRHVILGSVSRRVLDRAQCPVIVVPRGAHRDEA
ncbi:MAG: universal stress protein, partial [Solirubrobacteraceae bacterium]